MTGSYVSVLQDQFVDGRLVATPITYAQMTATAKVGDVPADGADADAKAFRKRSLKRKAHPRLLVDHLADDPGQPELRGGGLRVGLDLVDPREDEAGELAAAARHGRLP